MTFEREPRRERPEDRSQDMGYSERRGEPEPHYREGDGGRDYSEQGREMAYEARERGREMASEAGDRARDAAEQSREQAASGAERTAAALREREHEAGDGMQGRAAGMAADRMEQAAGYLRTHDTSELLGEVEGYVHEHPLQAVAMAVGAGFIVGRMLR